MRQDHLFDTSCSSEETHYRKEFMPEMDVRLNPENTKFKFSWFDGADKEAFMAKLPQIHRLLLWKLLGLKYPA